MYFADCKSSANRCSFNTRALVEFLMTRVFYCADCEVTAKLRSSHGSEAVRRHRSLPKKDDPSSFISCTLLQAEVTLLLDLNEVS